MTTVPTGRMKWVSFPGTGSSCGQDKDVKIGGLSAFNNLRDYLTAQCFARWAKEAPLTMYLCLYIYI